MKERPDVLESETQRVETARNRLYITITHDSHGEPFEVFVNCGQSGGHTHSWCEAVGKLASIALRSGADPREVSEYLMGIRGPLGVATDNGDTIHSIPDAVGVALERDVEGSVGESVRGEGK
jgi:ribonucleoside-diphosphate reductase alpha chain